MQVRLPTAEGLIDVVERARRIFDLGADPLPIEEHLRRSPALRSRVAAAPGLRVPGAWDGFELAVRAIIGQQVSVRGATTLAGRLVRAFGTPVSLDAATGLTHLFPLPGRLAEADVSRVGITRARARTIRALATAVCEGRLSFDTAHGLEDSIARLCAIPGIGKWTAHYVAMRAGGEPDAFPVDDLGLRRAAAGGGAPVDVRTLARMAEAWRPWRAYAALHLWNGAVIGISGKEESHDHGHRGDRHAHRAPDARRA
jgi:AraC family transcriptional regulator of adaptative response / DNA-3-methyladenine glycosylase II